jgi:hypothetical protein
VVDDQEWDPQKAAVDLCDRCHDRCHYQEMVAYLCRVHLVDPEVEVHTGPILAVHNNDVRKQCDEWSQRNNGGPVSAYSERQTIGFELCVARM